MDKGEAAGLGAATVGHVALFAVLSLGVAASIPPRPKPPPSMDVEFIDDAALESAAPVAQVPVAAEAPEVGTPAEAMPQPAPTPRPLPRAPEPEPEPEPVPAPRPEPVRQPEPVAAKPRPEPAKRVVARPDPTALARAKAAQAKVEKARSDAAKLDAAKLARAKAGADAKAKAVAAAEVRKNEARLAAAAAGKGKEAVQKRKRLGSDILAGVDSSAEGKGKEVAATVVSKDAMAGIVAAIKRQVQPCANRQVNPGPGASRILVKLSLRLNRDGSLAAAPKVLQTSGVDDENSRYEKRVADLAIAAYTGCAPMRGLPPDLYAVKNGWKAIYLNYKLPG